MGCESTRGRVTRLGLAWLFRQHVTMWTVSRRPAPRAASSCCCFSDEVVYSQMIIREVVQYSFRRLAIDIAARTK